MARKWSVFFGAVQSVLKWRVRGQRRTLAIALCAALGWIGALSLPALTADSPNSGPVSVVEIRGAGEMAIALVERGQRLYNQGNFPEAVGVWQEAVAAYRTAGDWLNEAMALSNLSLTYQKLGEWNRAQEAIGQSLQRLPDPAVSNAGPDGVRILAQSLDIYGKLQLERGNPGDAIATWKRTATLYQQLRNPDQQRQSLINQAQALQVLGLYSRACDTLLQGFGETPNCQILLEEPPGDSQRTKSAQRLISRLSAQPANLITANGLRRLGDILRPLGRLHLSEDLLLLSQNMAQQLGSGDDVAAAWLSLGNTALAIGNQERDKDTPETIVLVPVQIDEITPMEKALQPYQKSLNYYQKIVNNYPGSRMALEAEINHLNLLIDIKNWWNVETQKILRAQNYRDQLNQDFLEKTSQLADDITELVNQNWPLTSNLINSRINFADNLLNGLKNEKFLPLAETILNQAVQDGKTIGNSRIQSYALGSLGSLYEQQEREAQETVRRQSGLDLAKDYTEQALALLNLYQSNNSGDRSITYADDRDLGYRWEWQLGRILEAQGNTREAIQVYDQAFEKLKSLRSDLGAINRDVQFYFRDQVEPFYREYAALLLTPEQPSQTDLEKTIEIFEALQLAEIDNLFQDPCSEIQQQQSRVDFLQAHASSNSAILYTMVLEASHSAKAVNPNSESVQIHLLLQRPQGIDYARSSLEKNKLATSINNFNKRFYVEYTRYLSENRSPENERERLNESKPEILEMLSQYYDWMIRPLEAQLKAVQTVVFVLDTPFQNIPVAALYDGQQYLIENKSVAFIPSWQLMNPNPLEVGQGLKVLAGGLSQGLCLNGERDCTPEQRQVTELPSVEIELDNIPTRVKLLNAQFTPENLQRELNRFRGHVVHLATHGQFSSNPEKTVIETFTRAINLKELEKLLQDKNTSTASQIKLLVLSACDAAQGDPRAVLGLAGVALRSGVSSAIAPLWLVKDSATAPLMIEFYRLLQQEQTNKAEALRQAQLALLQNRFPKLPDDYRFPKLPDDYSHPAYWAPYVLVGNWL
ncbi:CHAT domain-containing protein [Oscillatoria acuminata]|uniref:CHAT domain-containing protein n=1 Tax=Oscillatoria acuminata PCC 6304 TaxID=56110 RepID=K9TKN9_9CYAN|nr:CHAT domain-containing protein [Oscillatoria acuminata]AFY83417.1 hypothetical protein Oscil6304_3862 [Oscillatoria acuminata PCC 6304]